MFTGKIPIEKYKDKIVLDRPHRNVGVGSRRRSRLSNPSMAPVLTLAHSVSSILNEDFFIEPEWGYLGATWRVFLLVALYLMLLMPRLKAGVAFVVSLVLVLALVASALRA